MPSLGGLCSLTRPLREPRLDFFLWNCPPLLDRFQRLQGQLIASLLFSQPLPHCLAHDPALAAINAASDLVQARDEIGREFGSDYTSIIHVIPVHLYRIAQQRRSANAPPWTKGLWQLSQLPTLLQYDVRSSDHWG
jgi:hypothetical protein